MENEIKDFNAEAHSEAARKKLYITPEGEQYLETLEKQLEDIHNKLKSEHDPARLLQLLDTNNFLQWRIHILSYVKNTPMSRDQVVTQPYRDRSAKWPKRILIDALNQQLDWLLSRRCVEES